jgi:energy-coupling factor transporter ATP-binding protein EcfA2
MTRLGRFVALAGRNGAGKTRLLKQVEACLQQRHARFSDLANLSRQISGYSDSIKSHPHHPNANSWRNELTALQMATLWIQVDPAISCRPLRFVPKKLQLTDPASLNGNGLKAHFDRANTANVEAYHETVLPYIQHRQDRWWNATHQHSTLGAAKRAEEVGSYESLRTLIAALLDADLNRNVDGGATLFDSPIAQAQLSDGQKVALQLATALHAKGQELDDTVFLLDEPENHLHPAITIDLLDRLAKAAPNAQFWIATHSVPLLAHIHSLDPMALWFMDKGGISHAGRHPKTVLNSLLGDEDRIARLHAFTGLPAELARIQFATECLAVPKVVNGGEGDPQVNQIASVLSNLTSGGKLAILDFGAGQGRLLEGLAVETEQIADTVDYYAVDASAKNEAACREVIRTFYGSDEGRYFHDEDGFFSAKNDGSIQVVVLCNVLHEILPTEWLSLFGKTSLIRRALAPDGYVLLVEDQRIPVGEKAHQYGFLVLDTPQLRTLFGIKEEDKAQFIWDERRDGRLKAHLIGTALLDRITAESRSGAVEQLHVQALKKIKEIRGQDYSYANGQAHGFWTQQLANAHMFLIDDGYTVVRK